MSDGLTLTFLVENTSCDGGILPEHGLAVAVGFGGQTLLYDTGQSGLVVDNAACIGMEISEFSAVAISHGHYDHAGGLLSVLEQLPGKLPVHAGAGFFRGKYARRPEGDIHFNGISFPREKIEELAGGIFEHAEPCAEILPGFFLVGPAPLTHPHERVNPRFLMKNPAVFPDEPALLHAREQKESAPDAPGAEADYIQDFFDDERSLIVDAPEGLVILAGCAHRGALNILAQAQDLFPGRDIFGLFGGFHLNDATPEMLAEKADIFEQLGLNVIGLSHCTGGKASRYLQDRLGERCFICPAGTELKIQLD